MTTLVSRLVRRGGACALALVAAASLSGCLYSVRGPVVPPVGSLFTATAFPVDTVFHETKVGGREGRAEMINILGLVALGDVSVQEAARNGGITTVETVDATLLSILGIYIRYEIVVTGE